MPEGFRIVHDGSHAKSGAKITVLKIHKQISVGLITHILRLPPVVGTASILEPVRVVKGETIHIRVTKCAGRYWICAFLERADVV
ncbi:hypothetical protein ACHAWO_011026 [Cyclotella atomus]|uniref:Uncharacterized protein n=1 Tax=Cyclotella atomus TaxID=382360 RepID=A0ABD3QJ68_9STRA